VIKAFNKQIACTPVENRTVASEVKSGFAVVKNKVELVKLKVIFGCDEGPTVGDTVFIKGDAVNHAWCKDVFNVEGVSVILVPLQFVQMVENNG
jgi:hypothetical protein